MKSTAPQPAQHCKRWKTLYAAMGRYGIQCSTNNETRSFRAVSSTTIIAAGVGLPTTATILGTQAGRLASTQYPPTLFSSFQPSVPPETLRLILVWARQFWGPPYPPRSRVMACMRTKRTLQVALRPKLHHHAQLRKMWPTRVSSSSLLGS